MTLIWYHRDCMDGLAAAAAASLALKDAKDPLEVLYFPVQHGELLPPCPAGADVYILDFCPPAAELAALCRQAARVTVLDHHKSAADDVQAARLAGLPNLTVVFDQAHSGAVLAWQHFHPGRPVPPLFAYIEDRDLWSWRLSRSREINDGLRSRNPDLAWLANMALADWDALGGQLVLEGQVIRRDHQVLVDRLVERPTWLCLEAAGRRITPLDLDGVSEVEPGPGCWVVPAVNTAVLVSETAEALRLRTGWPAAAVWFQLPGSRVFSLRSDGRFDCTLPAKAFGGGGHAAAAGFSVPGFPC